MNAFNRRKSLKILITALSFLFTLGSRTMADGLITVDSTHLTVVHLHSGVTKPEVVQILNGNQVVASFSFSGALKKYNAVEKNVMPYFNQLIQNARSSGKDILIDPTLLAVFKDRNFDPKDERELGIMESIVPMPATLHAIDPSRLQIISDFTWDKHPRVGLWTKDHPAKSIGWLCSSENDSETQAAMKRVAKYFNDELAAAGIPGATPLVFESQMTAQFQEHCGSIDAKDMHHIAMIKHMIVPMPETDPKKRGLSAIPSTPMKTGELVDPPSNSAQADDSKTPPASKLDSDSKTGDSVNSAMH
jgi:hypothetical protein